MAQFTLPIFCLNWGYTDALFPWWISRNNSLRKKKKKKLVDVIRDHMSPRHYSPNFNGHTSWINFRDSAFVRLNEMHLCHAGIVRRLSQHASYFYSPDSILQSTIQALSVPFTEENRHYLTFICSTGIFATGCILFIHYLSSWNVKM